MAATPGPATSASLILFLLASPSQRDITHGNVDRYVTYPFGPDSSVCGDVSLNAAAGEMTPLLSVFCGMPLSFRTNARETRPTHRSKTGATWHRAILSTNQSHSY